MFVYQIQERWDGQIDRGSKYSYSVFTRGFASRIAKKLFLKKRPGRITETDLNTSADDPYLANGRYQVLVIYHSGEENPHRRNGEVVEVWDSTYGRHGRKLTVQERKEAFPFQPLWPA